jgi:hypothetical protein
VGGHFTASSKRVEKAGEQVRTLETTREIFEGDTLSSREGWSNDDNFTKDCSGPTNFNVNKSEVLLVWISE